MASSRPSTATPSSEATMVRPPAQHSQMEPRPTASAPRRTPLSAPLLARSALHQHAKAEGGLRARAARPSICRLLQGSRRINRTAVRGATTAESGRRAGHRGALKFTLASESTSNLPALHTTETTGSASREHRPCVHGSAGRGRLARRISTWRFARSARSSRATAARAALGAAPWRAGGRSRRPR